MSAASAPYSSKCDPGDCKRARDEKEHENDENDDDKEEVLLLLHRFIPVPEPGSDIGMCRVGICKPTPNPGQGKVRRQLDHTLELCAMRWSQAQL